MLRALIMILYRVTYPDFSVTDTEYKQNHSILAAEMHAHAELCKSRADKEW